MVINPPGLPPVCCSVFEFWIKNHIRAHEYGQYLSKLVPNEGFRLGGLVIFVQVRQIHYLVFAWAL